MKPKRIDRSHTLNLYRKVLQKSVTRQIVCLVLFSAALFLLCQWMIGRISMQRNAEKHMQLLKETHHIIENQNCSFLQDENVLKTLNERDLDTFRNLFRQFNKDTLVYSDVLIINQNGNVVYTSMGEGKMTSYLLEYNRAVCHKADAQNIYRSVYYETGQYADPMYIFPLEDGYITLFVSGSDWNTVLADRPFDGVITDGRSNILYSSKHAWISPHNKFEQKGSGLWTDSHQRYWVETYTSKQQDIRFYSMVYDQQENVLWIELLFFIITGGLWIWSARSMARSMAINQSEAVDELVGEIRRIGQVDRNHRIQSSRKDEFAEIAGQINEMLDAIEALHMKNTELIKLNNRFEYNQLTAQMNPHFMYNTLELIRNLVLSDPPKAESLILKFTKILRYSVDLNNRQVSFGNDLIYIQQYIDIQCTRFEERLFCEFSIEESALDYKVPKLFLQPVLENSIKYSFKVQMDLHIEVTAVVENDILIITVKDDGPGMPDAERKALDEDLRNHDHHTKSIGLRNLSRRLYLEYGKKSKLYVTDNQPNGLIVYIHIERKKDEHV